MTKKDDLHGLSPFPDREGNRGAYGQLYGDILNELLGLVLLQQRERLTDDEVRAFAKSIFEGYVAEYLPEIAEQAARYWKARQAEQHRLQREMGDNETRRQERLKAEEAAREKAAAEAEAARYHKAQAEEVAAEEELSKIRAQQYRELQEKMLY